MHPIKALSTIILLLTAGATTAQDHISSFDLEAGCKTHRPSIALATCVAQERQWLAGLPETIAQYPTDAPITACLRSPLPSMAEMCLFRWQNQNFNYFIREKVLPLVTPANQALPLINVDEECRKEIDSDGQAGNQAAYDKCFERQQQSYDSLKRYWHRLPLDIAQTCGALRWSAKYPSYGILEMCVTGQIAGLSLKLSVKKRDFKY